MANKFEELLEGRAIESLSPDEIQEIIEKMSVKDIEKFEKVLTNTKTKRVSKTLQKTEDLINQAILKGLRK